MRTRSSSISGRMPSLPVLSTPEERRTRARKILSYLKKAYPVPETELSYKTPFQLVTAVMLSAQSTDKRVNMVTETLFKQYRTVNDFADADLATVGVSAQCEVHSGTGRSAEDHGIMSEQEFELVRETALEGSGQVSFADHMVVHAAEPERCVRGFQAEAFVDEHADAVPFEMLGHGLGIGPVVVVA